MKKQEGCLIYRVGGGWFDKNTLLWLKNIEAQKLPFYGFLRDFSFLFFECCVVDQSCIVEEGIPIFFEVLRCHIQRGESDLHVNQFECFFGAK